MKTSDDQRSFALIITLVLMAFIVVVVVAYLTNTRTDRSTASSYANRLRAKMIADSGLTAATRLLSDHTKFGNYITALPPAVPAPAPQRTEIYRPGISASDLSANPNDYLRLGNAVGDILSSRAVVASPAGVQTDERPAPASIPASGPFEVSNPGLTSTNSFDFNQIVRIGNTAAARLVNPDAEPAFGQWVRLRNSAGEVIGRYAFFIEDQSMKVNVNAVGNNVGGSHMRVDDMASPTPSPTPASQIEELDPAAVLAATANRTTANAVLTALGAPDARIATASTLGLLNEWTTNFADYAHLITVASKDDNTTARGWKKLDLNKVVADAEAAGTPEAKKEAAIRIADWIRDAWTGPTSISDLQDYQLYADDWARKQIAANIVDYIDSDVTPTDMGDLTPAGFGAALPVVGLEKTPYLAAVDVIYQASNSTYPGTGSGTFTATMRLRLLLRFFNMYDTTLDLVDAMGSTPLSRIEISGVPALQKNGPVYSIPTSPPLAITLADLTPVNSAAGLSATAVAAGTDGTSTSGARTFQSPWLAEQTVTFTVLPTSDGPTRLAGGSMSVKVIGNRTGSAAGDYRVDETVITTNAVSTGYYRNASGSSAGDLLKDANTTNGPLQVASINYSAGYQGQIYAANSAWDPRYRPRLTGDRWNTTGRTDATYPCPWITPAPSEDRVTAFIDTAEVNPRTLGFDWCDYNGNRPLGFFRNGPLVNIGELGNVAASEYPWRSVYLQYPERNASTATAVPKSEIELRRTKTMDYVLADLLRTNSSESRSGAININTRQRVGVTQQHALSPLFLGAKVGALPALTQIMVDRLCTNTGNATRTAIFDRRSDPNAAVDNTPLRPFFQPAEIASVISRLVNTSVAGSGTSGSSPARSTVSYSMLRTNPAQASEAPVNANAHIDPQIEQPFRAVSNSITTRGNIFRVLYVGQSMKNGLVQAEYLAEAIVERQAIFTPDASNPDIVRTTDSKYRVIAQRVVTE